MPRFITNRWWTFILALVLGIGVLASLPVDRSYAATAPGSGSIGGEESTPGGGPCPPGNGDPDLPIGKVKPTRGGVVSPLSSSSLATVGDGRQADIALMWRLRIVMGVLRTLYLR